MTEHISYRQRMLNELKQSDPEQPTIVEKIKKVVKKITKNKKSK